MIAAKRIYAPAVEADGYRVLVDRIWPRGIGKAEAAVDLWLRTVAPSPELRRWFAHDPARWDEFRSRYAGELAAQPQAVALLRERAAMGPLTLVYAARDEARNNAVALKLFLERNS
ncbi:DUF488 domain-containing protein [Enterovirga aerilata]|uniref:DUF488 domain-containing protein n=1 Tax=Enterovirga aerilata TaxID=2730920 RepID=A0A849I5D5_9HYPH|nr:DUF488 domain-containing protein [Enterovirga sp. DB1703]NNM71310.1 DUF488 domain-containing protein [Enterovirga sp. DB1703]